MTPHNPKQKETERNSFANELVFSDFCPLETLSAF